MEKLEPTPMSDKVKDRIEKDAEAYAKSLNSSDGTARFDYIAGATTWSPKAWDEAIDEAIAKISKLKDAILPDEFASTYHDAAVNKALKLLEALKHKQP